MRMKSHYTCLSSLGRKLVVAEWVMVAVVAAVVMVVVVVD